MAKVEILGWRPGFKNVAHTKALQDHAGLGLGAAKAITDMVLDGRVAVVEVRDAQTAGELAKLLNHLGASAHVNADDT